MSYLRTTKTVLIRKMPLGTYLHVPYSYMLESYSPIMEIDDSTEALLELCDGLHTREDILQKLSEESGEPTEAFADDFDAFVQYLVSEGVLEWTEVPSYVEPLYKRNRPSAISIDLTTACNLKCPMCSSSAGAPLAGELTLDDVVPFVEQVKKIKPTPFALSGGEPLLRKDLVLYMVEELSPIREMVVTIFTNGTLVTKEYAQQLYDAGLRIARVSLDGHTAQVHDAIRGKGAFEKTVNGIKFLKDAGIHVNVISVISKSNYPYLKEIKEFVSQIGDSYGISHIIPAGRGINSGLLLDPEETFRVKMALTNLDRIETGVSPEERCNAGETIYIASNGDIFPCLYLNLPEFKVGNIKENDLYEIYENEVMQDILQLTVEQIEGCRSCEFRYYCAGGCRGFAYLMKGSLRVPDPVNCKPNRMVACRALQHGEEGTQKLLQELLKSTEALAFKNEMREKNEVQSK